MVFKVFVDVNVFLDYFGKREHFVKAEKIFELADNGVIDAFTSVSAFQTVGYFLQKYRGSQLAKSLLLEFAPTIELLESSKSNIVQALNSSIKDIEDAIHYYTAIEHKMDYLITNDIDFLKLDGTALNIKTPVDFLQLLQT